MTSWKNVLTLDAGRAVRGGSPAALADAIRRGADLRIHTDFHHNEHIDTASNNPELIVEVSEFRATYLVDDRWTAGIMTLRQPVDCPHGFGPRPSLSLFLYNQDGHQAIARLYLDGPPVAGPHEPSAPDVPPNMPKYHAFDAFDSGTNAPSQNFIYDFDCYEYFVRDDWRELLAHDAAGHVTTGSLAQLMDAFRQGAEIKAGVRCLCTDLAEGSEISDLKSQSEISDLKSQSEISNLKSQSEISDLKSPMPHEVFIQAFSGYYYTKQGLFFVGTHPFARVRPAIPMRYVSGGWDYAWLFVRTDGFVEQLLYDPYTLKTTRRKDQFAVRWFAR